MYNLVYCEPASIRDTTLAVPRSRQPRFNDKQSKDEFYTQFQIAATLRMLEALEAVSPKYQQKVNSL